MITEQCVAECDYVISQTSLYTGFQRFVHAHDYASGSLKNMYDSLLYVMPGVVDLKQY